LLPPPVPMVPFLLAAGAMQYPARKFLAALTLGRISRYLILAYLAARYGRQIIAFLAEHGHPVVVAIILMLIATAVVVFYFRKGSKNKKKIWTLGKRFFGRGPSISRAGQRSTGSRLREARHRS
jgi:uncharacterized membrane protein YdjX (TVP38/TMEM64 family)